MTNAESILETISKVKCMTNALRKRYNQLTNRGRNIPHHAETYTDLKKVALPFDGLIPKLTSSALYTSFNSKRSLKDLNARELNELRDSIKKFDDFFKIKIGKLAMEVTEVTGIECK